MLYVYDNETGHLDILTGGNLKERTVIIDIEFSADEDENKNKAILNNKRERKSIREMLLSEVELKATGDRSSKSQFPVDICFSQSGHRLRIGNDSINELIKKIGFLRMIFMKNPVYNIDGFLISMEKTTGRKAIIKTGGLFRMIDEGRLAELENIYDRPEMRLWEYDSEYMLILR